MNNKEIFNVADSPCCQGAKQCDCGPEERVLRSISSGRLKIKMTKKQRAWCISQAVEFGEGNYFENELASLDDQPLAESVLRAWNMNKESNYQEHE